MGKNMTKEELIKEAEKDAVTLEEIREFEERLREREKEFEQQERRQRPDTAWYERRYTI